MALDASRLATAIKNSLAELASQSSQGHQFGPDAFAKVLSEAIISEIKLATVIVTGKANNAPFEQISGTIT